MTFGKGKEKKGERRKLCFLLRVPLSCRAKHGNGGRRRAFLPGQCLFRFTHCHSIGRRTIFHSDICHSIRRRTNFSPSTCRSLCRRTILVAAICPSIRRKTNFTPSTCRSPCRRTILVAAICPSHHHRTNRVSTRGGARLLRLIVLGRRARQRVGVSRILCITNFPHGYLTAVFLLSFNTGESTFHGECAYLCVTSFPLFHFKHLIIHDDSSRFYAA